MFVAIIFALSLLIIWADWLAYKRCATLRSSWVKWVVAVALVAMNILPYIALVIMRLCDMPNMVPTMWLLTIYTTLALSRLALYAGVLLIKNRVVAWVVGGVLCGVALSVAFVGIFHTRKDLTIKSVDVVSSRLPKTFDGYRIALFSDTHFGAMIDEEKMCKLLVDKVNALDADLVVFGGDLVNVKYDELRPQIADILSRIEARDGVVAVLGNHDTGVYVRDTTLLPIEENTRLLKERIEAMGWRMIDDKTDYLVREKDTLTLTGIGFSRELLEYRHSANVADSLDLRPIYERVPSDKFNITVSHMPQVWRKVSSLGYGDLVLSGHVHSMQIKGHIGDFKFSPAQLMYKEWSGLYKEQNNHLYITDGVGSVGFHIRIGAPPEISLITLHCQ